MLVCPVRVSICSIESHAQSSCICSFRASSYLTTLILGVQVAAGMMMSPEEDMAASRLKVRLHPFLHQVSGSTLMFKFDNGTICKPLLPKEYHFYKFLPDSLKEFTARYKGKCLPHFHFYVTN